jgi:hypothetical protein
MLIPALLSPATPKVASPLVNGKSSKSSSKSDPPTSLLSYKIVFFKIEIVIRYYTKKCFLRLKIVILVLSKISLMFRIETLFK